MTLYEINADLALLLDAFARGGFVDPDTGELLSDGAAVLDQIDLLQLQKEELIIDAACFYKGLWAEAEALKTEADALTQRRKELTDRADRIEAMLLGEMQRAGWTKLTASRASIAIRQASRVEVSDMDALIKSGKYLRVKPPEPDKVAIGKAIKAGESVPGVALEVHTSVTIR